MTENPKNSYNVILTNPTMADILHHVGVAESYANWEVKARRVNTKPLKERLPQLFADKTEGTDHINGGFYGSPGSSFLLGKTTSAVGVAWWTRKGHRKELKVRVMGMRILGGWEDNERTWGNSQLTPWQIVERDRYTKLRILNQEIERLRVRRLGVPLSFDLLSAAAMSTVAKSNTWWGSRCAINPKRNIMYTRGPKSGRMLSMDLSNCPDDKLNACLNAKSWLITTADEGWKTIDEIFRLYPKHLIEEADMQEVQRLTMEAMKGELV